MKLFLYIDPLKQGLKQEKDNYNNYIRIVFIHRSIKTRIETERDPSQRYSTGLFLYIDPLKQGLKL